MEVTTLTGDASCETLQEKRTHLLDKPRNVYEPTPNNKQQHLTENDPVAPAPTANHNRRERRTLPTAHHK